jgi:hypothetical protein
VLLCYRHSSHAFTSVSVQRMSITPAVWVEYDALSIRAKSRVYVCAWWHNRQQQRGHQGRVITPYPTRPCHAAASCFTKGAPL